MKQKGSNKTDVESNHEKTENVQVTHTCSNNAEDALSIFKPKYLHLYDPPASGQILPIFVLNNPSEVHS